MVGQNRFAVGVYPELSVQLEEPPTAQQLLTFAVFNLALLLRTGHALGTWFDKGVHVLDVVVCPSELDVALRLATRYGQTAVFDLATGSEIPAELVRLGSPALPTEGRRS